jgi:hypothetical protein
MVRRKLGWQEDGTFVDDSTNHVREVPSPDDRLRIMKLVDHPGRGYITDAEVARGNYYPGPVMKWYGERGGPGLKAVLDELLTLAFGDDEA